MNIAFLDPFARTFVVREADVGGTNLCRIVRELQVAPSQNVKNTAILQAKHAEPKTSSTARLGRVVTGCLSRIASDPASAASSFTAPFPTFTIPPFASHSFLSQLFPIMIDYLPSDFLLASLRLRTFFAPPGRQATMPSAPTFVLFRPSR